MSVGPEQSLNRKAVTVPTGKVKWYDAEKGFGFLSRDDGDDVYVRASSLPEGVTSLKAGMRVEFGVLSGRKGEQAHQVRVLDAPPSVSANRRAASRKKPEEMVSISIARSFLPSFITEPLPN